jgi:hypothetical protein
LGAGARRRCLACRDAHRQRKPAKIAIGLHHDARKRRGSGLLALNSNLEREPPSACPAKVGPAAIDMSFPCETALRVMLPDRWLSFRPREPGFARRARAGIQ